MGFQQVIEKSITGVWIMLKYFIPVCAWGKLTRFI